jgi:hypothetical protein
MGRDDHIYQEAAALWRELFVEPPPQADGSTLLGLIMSRMPDTGYERLRSAHLRAANIHMPSARA